MLDKYSKKPAKITASEGIAFVQKGSKWKKNKDKDDNKGKEFSKYDAEYFKDKICFRCGKKDHLKAAYTAKLPDNDKSSKSRASLENQVCCPASMRWADVGAEQGI